MPKILRKSTNEPWSLNVCYINKWVSCDQIKNSKRNGYPKTINSERKLGYHKFKPKPKPCHTPYLSVPTCRIYLSPALCHAIPRHPRKCQIHSPQQPCNPTQTKCPMPRPFPSYPDIPNVVVSCDAKCERRQRLLICYGCDREDEENKEVLKYTRMKTQ